MHHSQASAKLRWHQICLGISLCFVCGEAEDRVDNQHARHVVVFAQFPGLWNVLMRRGGEGSLVQGPASRVACWYDQRQTKGDFSTKSGSKGGGGEVVSPRPKLVFWFEILDPGFITAEAGLAARKVVDTVEGGRSLWLQTPDGVKGKG